MKVTFNTEELKKYLAKLGAVVQKKATIPVYGFVRLYSLQLPAADLGPPKFSVAMIGIDIDSSLQLTFAKATASDEVDVLLPFAKLAEIVGNVSASELVLDTDGETKAELKAGKYKANLKTHPLSNWPTMMDRPEKQLATLALPALKDQIGQVEFAVPASDGKFIVSVAKVESTAEALTLIATDGFRLAISTLPGNAGAFSLTLPKPALELVKKMDGGQITIYEGEAGFYFDTELETLTVNRTNGEFPPYQQILPKSFTTQIIGKKKALVEAVKRARPLADSEKPKIVFTVAANAPALQLAADSVDSGSDGINFRNAASDEVDVATTGPANEFALDVNLLLPFLETSFGSGDGDITIRVQDGTKVVDFIANGGNYRFLQMPMQQQQAAAAPKA